MRLLYLHAAVSGLLLVLPVAHADEDRLRSAKLVLQDYCVGCHSGDAAEAGLDLEQFTGDPESPEDFEAWVLIHDRVVAAEMPPDDPLAEGDRVAFVRQVNDVLVEVERQQLARSGRAVWRRMNRFEYENTLRDVLATPWLQIKQILPEDGEAHGFNKVGEALDTSHVQIARYLQAADEALRQVVAPSVEPPDSATRRYYVRDQSDFAGRLRYNEFNRSPERAVFPLLGNRADLEVLNDEAAPASLADQDPARRDLEAFGVVASAYEPLEPSFNDFTAPVSGRYRLRFSVYTFWAGPGKDQRWWRPERSDASQGRRDEPVVVYSEAPPRMLRRLGQFDAYPWPQDGEGNVSVDSPPPQAELEVELLKGETIRPDAARLFRSRPPNWHNPLATEEGMPGVAFRWMEVEGPLFEMWPPKGHRVLFEDLPLRKADDGVEIIVEDATTESERLIRRFLDRAYRRPVRDEDVQRFHDLTMTALESGSTFRDAMIAGYAAVLCSPEFVCIQEPVGTLDDYALATRLSYFLWNTAPDEELRRLADQGVLHQPDVLREQTERLLDDPKSSQFIDALLDYWLQLRAINDTSPNEVLYPDYYLDDLLVDSALAETRRFFAELVRENLPARNLIDSDFAFVNERLAEHYELPPVSGVGLQKIDVPADSIRGGLLTQASILKVTANGTTTSPVKRGAWVMERLLGKKPPPPPPDVPAIEPDTRGAKTIREQLAKHRALDSCNRCHKIMDPVGFALESFDVLGGFRESYRALGSEEGTQPVGFGKNGQPFTFRLNQPVDCSGQLATGEPFEDIAQLQELLLKDEEQVARNLIQQLVVYSTAAPVRFADRAEIESILQETRADQYGVRSIIRAIVQSDLFRTK